MRGNYYAIFGFLGSMYMIFLISLVQLEWSGLVGKDSYAKFAYRCLLSSQLLDEV